MAMSKVRSQRVVDGTADNKDSELGFQMSCTLRLSAAQKQGNGEWLPGLMSASNQPPVLDWASIVGAFRFVYKDKQEGASPSGVFSAVQKTKKNCKQHRDAGQARSLFEP